MPSDLMLDTEFINLLIQGGFAALFIWLLRESRRDSREREAKLTEHLDAYYNTLPKIVETLNKIEARLERIEFEFQSQRGGGPR